MTIQKTLFHHMKLLILLLGLAFSSFSVSVSQSDQLTDQHSPIDSSLPDKVFVIDVIGPIIYFNLGFEQGVKKGMRFDILSETNDAENKVDLPKKGWIIVSETYADVSKGELKEISGHAPEIGDLMVFHPQASALLTDTVREIKTPVAQNQTLERTRKLPQISTINWKQWGVVGVGLAAGYLSLKSHRSMEQSLGTYNDAMNEGKLAEMDTAKSKINEYHRNRLIFGVTAASLLGFSSYQKFLSSNISNIEEKIFFNHISKPHDLNFSATYISISSSLFGIVWHSSF
ncbi:MAG: hypothetical protein VX830_04470 [Candidatus Poribacteria bacterium]|nr:hypothetical protein [Candidatus Poribacteria bacterium]